MKTHPHKEDFQQVRQTANGRAAQFVPELLLVRALKRDPEDKKITHIQVVDKFIEAGNKLKDVFPIFTQEYIRNNLMPRLEFVPHVEDLDPWILIIAAHLKYLYPNGLNFQGIAQQGSLTPAELQSDVIDDAAKTIMKLNDLDDQRTLLNIKADIASYYYLMVAF